MCVWGGTPRHARSFHSLQFDWLQHFQSFFSEVHHGANITNETLVIVQTPDYFHNLSAFLMEEALK